MKTKPNKIAQLIGDTVMEAVVETTGFTLEEIQGPRRYPSLSQARHIAVYLLREFLPGNPDRDLGSFVNRHHNVVKTAKQHIQYGMADDYVGKRTLAESRHAAVQRLSLNKHIKTT